MVTDKRKPAELLTSADLIAHPVWTFTGSDARGETLVRPVSRVPVKSLTAKILGTTVTLANKAPVLALMGNIDHTSARLTEQFLTVSVERDGRWFHLARYFDPDYSRRGPHALAECLSLSIDDVFPIFYDLRQYVVDGDPAALCGIVTREPRERLSLDELTALAVPPPGSIR